MTIGGTVVIAVAGMLLLGYFAAKRAILAYTDSEPAKLPIEQFTPSEAEAVNTRIADFQQAMRQDRAVGPLELSARDLNILIQTHSSLKPLRGVLYVAIRSNVPSGQISIPLDGVNFRPLKGRYLNGTATFRIGVGNGALQMYPLDLIVKGKRLPEVYARRLRQYNLASKVNSDPRGALAMEKIHKVEIRDGKLVLVPVLKP